MSAKLVSHDSKQPVSEVLFVARTEALHQRQRDYRRRKTLVYRLGEGPSALSRIHNIRLNAFKFCVFRKRLCGQIEEPRADNASVPPQFCDLCNVQIEITLLVKQRESLGVSLHQTVFDTVVHHLHEMPSARRTHVRPSKIR